MAHETHWMFGSILCFRYSQSNPCLIGGIMAWGVKWDKTAEDVWALTFRYTYVGKYSMRGKVSQEEATWMDCYRGWRCKRWGWKICRLLIWSGRASSQFSYFKTHSSIAKHGATRRHQQKKETCLQALEMHKQTHRLSSIPLDSLNPLGASALNTMFNL